MIKKLIAGLLAAAVLPGAASAQEEAARGEASGRVDLREMRRALDEARSEGVATQAVAAPAFQGRPQRQFDQPRPDVQPQPQSQPQARGGWQGRGDRGQRFDRPQQQAQPAQPQADWRRSDRQGGFNDNRDDWRRGDQQRSAPVIVPQNRGDQGRRWDGNGRDDGNRWNEARRRDDTRREDANRWNGGQRWDGNRGANGNRWTDTRRYDAPRSWNGSARNDWNRRWRDDNRYDWGRWRQQNRSLFRLPRYYAPYDWTYGYRRFSIGVTLSNLLWQQDYWIDDPWSYRLPEAYGPYRWVRYYNDALLVDTYTGEVVDAVYDIFY